MSKILEIARKLLTPPGDTLAEVLLELDMSPLELAEKMAVKVTLIYAILHAEAPITPEIARGLEQALGPRAYIWLARESRYREKLAWIEKQEALETEKGAQ